MDVDTDGNDARVMNVDEGLYLWPSSLDGTVSFHDFLTRSSRGATFSSPVRERHELLFVDGDGRFTEGTSCAVLAVVDGALYTAPWDNRILRSTTLERLLGHAAAARIAVVRQGAAASGPWDALYVATTTRCLSPVATLDGVALSTWDPIGRALQAAEST